MPLSSVLGMGVPKKYLSNVPVIQISKAVHPFYDVHILTVCHFFLFVVVSLLLWLYVQLKTFKNIYCKSHIYLSW